jgi:hypothetical protein
MALCTRFLITAVLVAGLGIASLAHAQHWHGGGNNYHQGGGNIIGVVVATPLARRS